MQNFKQIGDTVTLTAPAGGVVSGLGYKIGQIFVVATATVAVGLPFEGKTAGVYEIVKDSGTAWVEGELLYWDDSAKNVVDASGSVAGKLLIGAATKAAASDAVIGEILLNASARPDGVSDVELDDNAVDTAAIQDVAVTTPKIALDAIDGTLLADDAVDSEHYTDASIDNEHLANDAVNTEEIADDAVTTAKIDMIVSGELTGDGSEQDFAHGLGGVPATVLVILTEFADTLAVDIAYGAHDATNTKVTVTSAAKYKLLVIL